MKEKFKLMDIATVKKVSNLFAGNYKTVFHGAGIEFSELKQYSFGEDVKNIDWITTAKVGDTFVKKYEEERELDVLFLLDIGESMYFSSKNKSKIDSLTEIFNILAFSSLKNNDKIGASFFMNGNIKQFESKKGISNLLMIMKFLNELKDNNSIGLSSFDSMLENLYLTKKKNSLIFILSDFTGKFSKTYFKALAIKNDIIFINIFDEFEDNLGSEGIHNFSGNITVNFNESDKIKKYKKLRQEKKLAFKKEIIAYSGDYIEINNNSDIFLVLYKFFKSRQ